MRKENEKAIVKLFIMLIVILIIGFLFKYEHYFFGLFILITYLSFVEDFNLRHIYAELFWIKDCVMGISDSKDLEKQADFYAFVDSKIRDKTIRKDMSIEMIYENIDKAVKKSMKDIPRDDAYYEQLKFRNGLYFKKEDRGIDESVELYGWGFGIPTQVLRLRFRNNRLIECERDALSR